MSTSSKKSKAATPGSLPKFAVGDIVRMRPSGPPMVVDEVHDKAWVSDEMFESIRLPGQQPKGHWKPQSPVTYTCRWFVGRKPHKEVFREEILETVPTDEYDE